MYFMESSNAYNEAKKFLESRKIKGEILFCMVSGSQVYDLAHAESSDIDYLGVYLAPSR